ncbi:MAG: hypothetical protein WBA74_25385 [Cyclobacteriaceae bacterium]
MKTLSSILNFLKRHYGLFLLAVAMFLFVQWKKEKKINHDYEQIQVSYKQTIETWKDREGKQRIRAEVAEIAASNTRTVLSKSLQRALQKEVGNLKKNLLSYTAVKATTNGMLKVPGVTKVHLTSVEALSDIPTKQFSIEDDHIRFEATYLPSSDTLITKYQIQHNFEVFHYYIRPGKPPFNFLRRKQAVAEIKFHNPATQGDSLYTVILKRKKGFLARLFE